MPVLHRSKRVERELPSATGRRRRLNQSRLSSEVVPCQPPEPIVQLHVAHAQAEESPSWHPHGFLDLPRYTPKSFADCVHGAGCTRHAAVLLADVDRRDGRCLTVAEAEPRPAVQLARAPACPRADKEPVPAAPSVRNARDFDMLYRRTWFVGKAAFEGHHAGFRAYRGSVSHLAGDDAEPAVFQCPNARGVPIAFRPPPPAKVEEANRQRRNAADQGASAARTALRHKALGFITMCISCA